MAKNANARILHKIDTEEHWNLAQNFIPLKGEMIIYGTDETHPYLRTKIGDGATNVSLLPFSFSNASSVETDGAIAYEKSVPEGALPYAEINRVGGMSRKCKNLFGGDAFANKLVEFGGYKNESAGTVYLAGGYARGKIAYTNFKANTQYTFIIKASTNTIGGINLCIKYTDGTRYIPQSTATDTAFIWRVVSESGKTVESFSGEWQADTTYYYNECGIFEGVIEQSDYEPYYSELRDTAVTEIKSVGVNLISYPYDLNNASSAGVTFTANPDRTITASGTTTNIALASLSTFDLKAGTYTISLTTSVVQAQVWEYNNNALGENLTGTFSQKATFTISADTKIRIRFYINNGITVNETFNVMLNKGTTALPYTPYTETSFVIPEAVQALDGYGWGVNEDCYNYIDYEKKQFVKRVGKIDMGNVNFQYGSAAVVFSGNFPTKAKGLTDNLIADRYVTTSGGSVYEMPDLSIRTNESGTGFYIKNTAYTDAASFKAAMQGVMLYYELATPIVTDITDLITADNFIKVEGGGIVTLVNEYNKAAPSEITYYISDNVSETIGAKTIVGDLVGTAQRAIGDENGNIISKSYALKSDTGYVEKEAGKGLSTNDYTTAEKDKLASLNNYTLPPASASLGGVKTGGDVVISDGLITVNDDSHNHIIENVDGLQTELDKKVYLSKSEIDSAVVYEKDVPSNALPYAELSKLGGMTYKCNNLFNQDQFFAGRGFTKQSDGSWLCNTIHMSVFTPTISDKMYFKVTAKSTGAHTSTPFKIQVKYSDGTDEDVCSLANSQADWITLSGSSNSSKTITSIYFTCGGSAGTTETHYIKDLIFSYSDVPYEPYYEGLRNTAVTEIKSVGANLFGGKALADKLVELSNATKDEVTGIVSYPANSVSGDTFYTNFKPNTQYTFIFYGRNTSSTLKTCNMKVDYTDGTASNAFRFVSDENSYIIYTSTAGKTINRLYGSQQGGTTTLYYDKCGIFEGVLTEADFKPYTETSLAIPEAVQALDGYGWGINADCYNYVDWDNKQFVKRVERLALDGATSGRVVSYVGRHNLSGLYYWTIYLRPAGTVLNPLSCICNTLETYKSPDNTRKAGTVYLDNAGDKSYITVYPIEQDLNSKELANSHLAEQYADGNPVILYYELDTPEVTDISALFPEDNLIRVEANGVIRAENEYNQAAPSEVTYYISEGEVEAIGAKTVVGDLVGTAQRAISDENGNRISETYLSKNGNDSINCSDIKIGDTVLTEDILKKLIENSNLLNAEEVSV